MSGIVTIFSRKRKLQLSVSDTLQLLQRKNQYLEQYSDDQQKWHFGIGMNDTQQQVILAEEQHYLPAFDLKAFTLAKLRLFLNYDAQDDPIVINEVFSCITLIELSPNTQHLLVLLKKGIPSLNVITDASNYDSKRGLIHLDKMLKQFADQYSLNKIKFTLNHYRAQWLLRKSCRNEYNILLRREEAHQLFTEEFRRYQGSGYKNVSTQLIKSALEINMINLLRDVTLSYLASEFAYDKQLREKVLQESHRNLIRIMKELTRVQPSSVLKSFFENAIKDLYPKKANETLKIKSFPEVLNSINLQLNVHATILSMERARLLPLVEKLNSAERELTQFIDKKINELDEITPTVTIKQEDEELTEAEMHGANTLALLCVTGP